MINRNNCKNRRCVGEKRLTGARGSIPGCLINVNWILTLLHDLPSVSACYPLRGIPPQSLPTNLRVFFDVALCLEWG